MYSASIQNVYMHEKGKIILFSTVEEASNFVSLFFDYAMNRAAQEGGLGLIPQIMMAQGAVTIEEYKGTGAETVEFKDVKR